MDDDMLLALEEYKIIQTKIDNLGANQFKVKTWSVSLTLGALVGGKFYGLDFWIYLIAVLIPSVFYLLERKLELEVKRLGERAKLIEILVYKLRRKKSPDNIREIRRTANIRNIPGIAHWVMSSSNKLTKYPKLRLKELKNKVPEKLKDDKSFLYTERNIIHEYLGFLHIKIFQLKSMGTSIFSFLASKSDSIFYFGQITALVITGILAHSNTKVTEQSLVRDTNANKAKTTEVRTADKTEAQHEVLNESITSGDPVKKDNEVKETTKSKPSNTKDVRKKTKQATITPAGE